MKKRFLSIMLTLCMMLSVLPFTPVTATAVGTTPTIPSNAITVGDLKIWPTDENDTLAENTDYKYDGSSHVLTISAWMPISISGTTTRDRIVVAKNTRARITLVNLRIDVSSDTSAGAGAFLITDDSISDVIITLADNTTNILKSGLRRAGIEKSGNTKSGSLIIRCANGGESGHVCGASCGTLEASSTRSAGIGSGFGSYTGPVSNITITGGNVTASSKGGAGIGSGDATTESGGVSHITISGGNVMVSSENGAGIGSGHTSGGSSGLVSNITISGGNVTVSSGTGSGIGNGHGDYGGGEVSNITISGGSVTASSTSGVGIGGANPGDIIISGGSVKASTISVTPTDGKGNNISLHIIDNPKDMVIAVNGISYPSAHTYYDTANSTWTTEKKVYAYVHGEPTIKLTDITAPTGEIKLDTNNWDTFLNNVTFGLFFKDTQEVAITATDNSGDDVKIEYLLSDKELTETELSAATFTTYSDKFTVEPNNEYVIYAKLTDKTGNVTYINSNGIVLDNIAPVISGIENGKTYCKAQTVTVSDKYEVTVTVNGKPVTLDTNGQFTLSPAEGKQTVVVTDKVGNVSAEMIVTVNGGHEGGTATCTKKAVCKHCGLEYGEIDNSNHDLEHNKGNAATVTATGNKEYWHCKACSKNFSDKDGKNVIDLKDTVTSKLAPEIIDGKGQSLTAGEKKELTFRSNAAYSDFIRVELDGKTVDEKNYTVKEGSTIVILKADYVATLSAGEHTIGIVSESATATTTFTVHTKVVDINSPQTGDNSNMVLWFALLLVSGGALAGTVVYGKKKKRFVK